MRILPALAIGFLFALTACEADPNDPTNKPFSTGPAGEMVVVIDDYLWNSFVGDTIFHSFARAQFGLPQDEPEFHVVNITHRGFASVVKQHRKVMLINHDKNVAEEKVEVKRDSYARDQLVVNVQARTPEKLVELIQSHRAGIMQLFHKTERDKLAGTYSRKGAKQIAQQLETRTGVKLALQHNTKIVAEEKDFTWLKLEKVRPAGSVQHQISIGIMVYEVPYRSQSQFLPDSLMALRDSITRQHVPGPSDSTWMTISHRMADPMVTQIEHNGQFATEMRGLWRVENDFMGGPFVSLAQVDEARNRIVVVDGYVFAPQFDKRNYLLEAEAMVYSMEFSAPQ